MTVRLVLPLLLVGTLAGCRTVSAKDQDLARVEYELAVQAGRTGDPRTALGEIEKSIEKDPENAAARNFHALVLHLYFGRLDEAVAEYRKAVELDPAYSEAKLNLGAALIAGGRYEEALVPLDQARRDLVFHDAHLAEGNWGWAKYKLGDREAAVKSLESAVAMNPGFCLGFRNLAEIARDGGDLDLSLRWLDRYGKACPAEPDADDRRGRLLLERGEACPARTAFLACRQKSKGGPLGETCGREVELIAGCPDPDETLAEP